MTSFHGWWIASAVVLMLFAAWVGRGANFTSIGAPTNMGLFIDVRERFSLNRFQVWMWTLLILSTFFGLLFENLTTDPGLATAIPEKLLMLMGITAGSATVAGAVKDGKNSSRPEKISGGNGFNLQARVQAAVAATAATPLAPQPPRFSQVFLEEEGEQAVNSIISASKFQSFLFTIAIGIVYVVLTAKAGEYPDFDERVLWLIGISHGGYIGGKLPNKD